MTSFTLAAIYHGRRVEVTWTDGRLSGNRSAVGAVATEAVAMYDPPAPASAGVTRHDPLTDAYSAFELILQILGPGTQLVAGDVPSYE